MEALGLTEEQAKKAIELLVQNLTFGNRDKKAWDAAHIVDTFFAVREYSEAMDWIWQVFPDHYSTTVSEYVIVKLENNRDAIWFKLGWC